MQCSSSYIPSLPFLSPCLSPSLSDASLQFGMESGLVIAVPIPAQSVEEREIMQAIDQAVLESKLVV